ncbi:glycoside hydrolase family 76 protein [Flavihumibacter sp. ZG627]|uniref:glycoside hydrolase family 76 protein n=1 Tax=Flavihumibacter sp. ZG627 TaxID=1463156 RepID=UPI00057DBA64|nr:glycoside hydrolase family 76 protein [Flavihumibacter sp. ZG627]KIC92295.1 hypothetical protein HY58_01750 [Flavihumibacter sp. ZG627]
MRITFPLQQIMEMKASLPLLRSTISKIESAIAKLFWNTLSCLLLLQIFSANSSAQSTPSTSKTPPSSLQPANRTRALLMEGNIRQVFYEPSVALYRETDTPSANEKPYSYLWPLCALIQCMQLADAKDAEKPVAVNPDATTRVDQVLKSIQQYYDTRPPAPGYASYVISMGGGDRFYDDNQWIGIALMDAYAKNKNPQYLNMSKEIYRYMMTGWDSTSGGGIYWKEGNRSTKNTCSNGPGIVLALQLYEATGKSSYLDTAKLLYRWVNRWLRSPKGVYWDNIKLPDGNKIDTATYSYNTGIMIQANAKLFRITSDNAYITEARQLARASFEHFFSYDIFHSTYWFNAVLLRGYEELYAIDNDPQYMNAMQRYADRVWRRERNVRNLIGQQEVRSLLDQAGMWEIYLRLSRYQKE